MFLVDTHCHLTDPPLCDDLPAVLGRAAAAGVKRIVVPAYDRASRAGVAALAERFGEVIGPALGLHPWFAAEPLDLDELAAGLRACRAVAVGEIGLDGKLDKPPLSVQIPVLERQLALARDLDLPVILHCRGAFAELSELLQRFAPRLRGVVHAYSRSLELARTLVDLGLHLGIGGAVTRPQARVRRAVASLPLAHLLLETDAPAIGLQEVEAEAAEPRHVREVAVAVAELQGIDVQAVATATTRNAAELFGRLAASI